MKPNTVIFDKDGFGRGSYSDLKNNLKLAFEPTGNPANEANKPSHTVYAETPGGMIDIGSAWTKVSQTGKQVGTKFLTLTLDDPSFDRKLNLTTWPQEGGEKGEFRIFWSRSEKQAA